MDSTPRRLQMKRTAGWRKPAGAAYVGRPSPYGNPFTFANSAPIHPAVRFAAEVAPLLDLAPLRGRDLLCWCRLCPAHAAGRPFGTDCEACATCHADTLLELANTPRRCEAVDALREGDDDDDRQDHDCPNCGGEGRVWGCFEDMCVCTDDDGLGCTPRRCDWCSGPKRRAGNNV